MFDPLGSNQTMAAAYEALVEFLYLAPVGIVKFRPDGTIDMANPTAAQLLMPLATDGDMSDLYRLLAGLAPDLRAHVDRYHDPAGQIIDQMQLALPDGRSTFMLDLNKINDTTLMAVVQNITDLTEARREVVRRTEAQRLLASVFMRLNTPVVVKRMDGFILLTNAAFQTLIGYDAKSLTGLNIDALLPPDSAGTAKAARAQQRLDGRSYQVEVELAAKGGARLLMAMHSTILDDADTKQLRVLTFLPPPPPAKSAAGGRDAAGPALAAGHCGAGTQIMTVGLSRYRDALSAEWPDIGARAVTLVEDVIKSRLGPSDIVKRGTDDSFVFWFVGGDAARHTEVLFRVSQGVHRVFQTEFGSKVANRVATEVAA